MTAVAVGIRARREGDVATVTLSNPGRLNAVSAAMWRSLGETFDALSADASLRCVVVTGEGEHFAAGGDIEEFLTLRDTEERARIYHGEWVAGALRAIRECTHPTIALIRGNCIGGGLEIAAECDLRIAAESSRFGAPIARLGFPMYHGELASLVALAGPAVALELLLEARVLPAQEACAKGLVTRVVADDRVESEALATARRIAAGAPLAARAHKRLVRRLVARAAELSAQEERAGFDYLATEDYAEGMRAFLDKRAPRFTGR